MKTIVPIIIIALVFVACSNNPYRVSEPAGKISSSADTAGFAQFQQWRQQQQVDLDEKAEPAVSSTAKKQTSSAPKIGKKAPVTYESRTSESNNAALPAKKKGWSKAAKGAAIGAGSGAVLGAVIHKRNRVVGGVVGGVVGAGAGYGIGRHMDKRDGRY